MPTQSVHTLCAGWLALTCLQGARPADSFHKPVALNILGCLKSLGFPNMLLCFSKPAELPHHPWRLIVVSCYFCLRTYSNDIKPGPHSGSNIAEGKCCIRPSIRPLCS